MKEAAAPVKLIEPSAMEGFFVSAAPRRPHHTRQSPEVLHSRAANLMDVYTAKDAGQPVKLSPCAG